MEIILELLLEIPLRILGEISIQIIFITIGYIFITIGYFWGFFPVLFFTLGLIEPGPIRHCDESGAFYRSQGMKYWHITYSVDGKQYLPAETVAWVGWGLICLIVAFGCFIVQVAGQ